ncbi:uncharacterized protein CLUP02_12720 [Colletotrichum lupini]|uniref:Uncharacterized protein n=1 Tax=Colletotrichum lupini TaxID=145971 RepID=A0A9Q8WKR4_9PEZI|nr:uncharacterized protein CLUP02_12720 [Colletotrichum lupini]UQC87218.1 hypothetical protein CLUP02_12720 [Colletotrichum lupini]
MGKSTYPPYIIVSLTICIDAGPKERMFKAEDESSPQYDYAKVVHDANGDQYQARSGSHRILSFYLLIHYYRLSDDRFANDSPAQCDVAKMRPSLGMNEILLSSEVGALSKAERLEGKAELAQCLVVIQQQFRFATALCLWFQPTGTTVILPVHFRCVRSRQIIATLSDAQGLFMNT